MGAQPGQHILTQGLRLQHDGVCPVTGDVACQPIGGSDVEFDHLAVAVTQLTRGYRPSGAPQRGGPSVGDPYPGLPAGRHLTHFLSRDPA